MLADEVDYVIGVDTHRDQHTLAVVAAPTGAVLAQTVLRANGRGYAERIFSTSLTLKRARVTMTRSGFDGVRPVTRSPSVSASLSVSASTPKT